jgi:hypothetical protein
MSEEVIKNLQSLKGQFDQATIDARDNYDFFTPWTQDIESDALEYEGFAFRIGYASTILQQGKTENAVAELTEIKSHFENTVQFWEKAEKHFFSSWSGLEHNKITEYKGHIEKLDIAIAPLLQNK